MKNKMNTVFLKNILCVSLIFIAALGVVSADDIGADTGDIGPTNVMMGASSIVPQVTETGKISLSVDGLGVEPENTGTIQVEKPAEATVRGAYMAAADVWGSNGGPLPDGAVQINSNDVNWDIHVSKHTNNAWSDVTTIVKPIVDVAPAGIVDLTITETIYLDGSILAVIFDDPNQATDNTIVLLFGAQDIAGDTFNIGLAEPIDKSDPNLVLDMSLGISFGHQTSTYWGQYSEVDVNSQRLTSSAGGEDDSDVISNSNGELLTVGGLGDSNTNPPDPNANGDSTSPRYDDELYNLLPFVSNGDTSINVYTKNPSNDDNIFFASLYMAQDITPPVAECLETVNPHGKKVPPAGSTTPPGPKGGQNEDGFYELIATDNCDPNPQIFVVDTGSGTEFGPFVSGTKIKYTEAPGATPEAKPIGSSNGQAGAIDWHIIGNGDPDLKAVDAAGNVGWASCLVPPPPK